ncbi:MAG: beta-glucuronidase [Sphaerochaeta sp.]|jgi:beta-glucuronidase|nr:beta-glucuronidase [Sphaerochaeta sp.]
MYPVSNKDRSIISLNGIWQFRFAGDSTWQPISVPGSFNTQLTDPRARYYCGIVEYQRHFTIPKIHGGERRVLRFDAVTHDAEVFLNGSPIGTHRGGFLPFEFDISALPCGAEHTLMVRVNNRIDYTTLPIGIEGGTAFFGSDNPGVPSVENGKKRLHAYNLPNFDFFNFAGITRAVRIYTTPQVYIKDITLTTDLDGEDGIIDYVVETSGDAAVHIAICDGEGELVGEGSGKCGTIRIAHAHLWYPRPGTPYLYTAHVTSDEDTYVLPVGIRSIEVAGNQFLINGKPFYFKGAGRHEDSPFRGRGTDGCLNVKDIDLLHWLNANSLRTSHYPYAEEMYALCDREGIVVIDELPAVGLNFHGTKNPYTELDTASYHAELLAQLIRRDKNHPSVVMWSLGNEPDTENYPEDAYAYWRALYDLAHRLDPQDRPVTVVCCQNNYTKDITAPSMDVVCINRYYGWYNLAGVLEVAQIAFNEELEFWQEIDKPLILAEYGADALPGLHAINAEMFSEEYQVAYLKAMNACLDQREFVVGEHPWVFADFDTQQGPMRPGGNHKGLFTRDRCPKMAAHMIRDRWATIEGQAH